MKELEERLFSMKKGHTRAVGRVILPADEGTESRIWLLAKAYVVVNDSWYHQLMSHWDSIAFSLAPDHPKAQEFPAVCRDIVVEYSKKIMVLAYALFELLSEALGLDHFHLKEKGCAEELLLLCNYYPPCPEPALTMGNKEHSDGKFVGISLENLRIIEEYKLHASDEVYLGQRDNPNWTDDTKVVQAFQKFGKKLKEIEIKISARNNRTQVLETVLTLLQVPYTVY
ncbi:hypothetical protein V8G54_000588 [Vigna mungo]|uniref:Lipoxygenase domain-containing protein n=1 Tax=Vigna mungo TaxID=3915 RepID=A0AAQ3S7E3_VIGMU